MSIVWEFIAFQAFPYLQYNLLFVMGEKTQLEFETSNTFFAQKQQYIVIKVTNICLIANLLLMGKLQMLSFSQKYVRKDNMKAQNPIKSHFGVCFVLFFPFHFAYSCFDLHCWAKGFRFPLNLIWISETLRSLELKAWNILFCWVEELVTIYLKRPFIFNSLRSYWKLLLKYISCPQLIVRDKSFVH